MLSGEVIHKMLFLFCFLLLFFFFFFFFFFSGKGSTLKGNENLPPVGANCYLLE